MPASEWLLVLAIVRRATNLSGRQAIFSAVWSVFLSCFTDIASQVVEAAWLACDPAG
jgi:hypothetical protein